MQLSKGTCDGKSGKYPCCGASNVYIVCKSRGQCIKCSTKYKRTKKKTHKKPANSHKRQQQIEDNKKYYAKAIMANIEKNGGVCRCDECGRKISYPIGRNVAHLTGMGSNLTLYHDIRNHVILGKGEMFGECNCLWKFDESGEWEKMKIAEHVKQIKETLDYEYYNK